MECGESKKNTEMTPKPGKTRFRHYHTTGPQMQRPRRSYGLLDPFQALVPTDPDPCDSRRTSAIARVLCAMSERDCAEQKTAARDQAANWGCEREIKRTEFQSGASQSRMSNAGG